MKEAEIIVTRDLIALFEYYLHHECDVTLKEMAKLIESKWLMSSVLISEETYGYVSSLVNFYAPTGVEPMNKEEAKDALDSLKSNLKKLIE
jgi:hypothetical protein